MERSLDSSHKNTACSEVEGGKESQKAPRTAQKKNGMKWDRGSPEKCRRKTEYQNANFDDIFIPLQLASGLESYEVALKGFKSDQGMRPEGVWTRAGRSVRWHPAVYFFDSDCRSNQDLRKERLQAALALLVTSSSSWRGRPTD